jgi:hypothetical protein
MTKSSGQLDVAISADISFRSAAHARAAVKALIPDNVNMPKGLTLEMFSRGRAVCIKVNGRGVPMGTVVNTVDEILDHLSVARKVMADG